MSKILQLKFILKKDGLGSYAVDKSALSYIFIDDVCNRRFFRILACNAGHRTFLGESVRQTQPISK